MNALVELRTNLTDLSNDVAEVQAPVNRAHLAARIAKTALAKPRQLSRAMAGLISKADTLTKSAVVLTPFPVIGTLAGRIGKILRKVKSTAERIKRAADRLGKRGALARKAVQTVLPPLNRAKMSLDRAQALLQGWLAIITELESRPGRAPPAEVEAACQQMAAKLAPDAKAVAGAKRGLTRDLEKIAGAFEDIEVACKPVEPALKTANDITRRLQPLQGPLNQLGRALRPVRWALDAASWVTRRVVDPIVDEILKAVGLKRLIDRLERSLNPFAAHVAPLQKAAARLSKAVRAIGDPGRIMSRLTRIPQLEKQVAANMRPLQQLSSTALVATRAERRAA